ncbi:Dysbindin like protein [Argiope bruennichi]|uniref:Dysbindin like protein n=1 Tax=Argiope bruennichi TaxID=94029 RepID=A0A8T0FFM0_ARGBR|nr:Dysbindin like protein [Argiope bruennichi]
MLENLRDKILNVQYDLSASFRNLATGDAQLSRAKRHNFKGITPNAGANLLHYYQQQWQELHENDSINAKKAEEVDALIGNLHIYCVEHLSFIKQLNIQLAALPQLQTGIMDLMGKIEVEDALVNLEDVIETQELQERQLDHRFQLAMYKEKKLADFEDMKAKLGEEHAHRVQEFEKRQSLILKERQNTFQEVFEEEVKEYKKHGLKELRRKGKEEKAETQQSSETETSATDAESKLAEDDAKS